MPDGWRQRPAAGRLSRSRTRPASGASRSPYPASACRQWWAARGRVGDGLVGVAETGVGAGLAERAADLDRHRERLAVAAGRLVVAAQPERCLTEGVERRRGGGAVAGLAQDRERLARVAVRR